MAKKRARLHQHSNEPMRRPRPPLIWSDSENATKIYLLLVSAVVVVFTLLGAWLWWQAHSIVGEFSAGNKLLVIQAAEPELNKTPARSAGGISKATTILLLGSDVRPGEGGHGRSDSMLLLRLDPKNNTASILSLPRDLRVPIPGHGQDKLTHAYAYGGTALTIATIREWLGVPINHFFQIDFSGFVDVVNRLGGAYLPIDGRYFHQNDGTAAGNWAEIDLRPGYQKLSGRQTLSWVRFRHLDSDFSRAARQQIFLRELGRQLRAQKADVSELPGTLRIIAKATTSDVRGIGQATRLANTLRQIPAERINRVTMQADPVMLGGVFYLEAGPANKAVALRSWSQPRRRLRRQKRSAHHQSTAPLGSGAELIPDGGTGKLLAQRLNRLWHCSPTSLPQGFFWPTPDSATHAYRLRGYQTAALYATRESGSSILWSWTKWDNPPILDNPSKVIRRGGRVYALYYESGALRAVAWRDRTTTTWITNTLDNTLGAAEMMALAQSCRH